MPKIKFYKVMYQILHGEKVLMPIYDIEGGNLADFFNFVTEKLKAPVNIDTSFHYAENIMTYYIKNNNNGDEFIGIEILEQTKNKENLNV
jgi:hypothetical protein